MSFSTTITENGCSPSELTEEDLDDLRTELSKVMQLFVKPLSTIYYKNTKREKVLWFNSMCSLVSVYLISCFVVLSPHRWRMKFRLCDRCFLSKRNVQQTSGGSWV